jgi:hypothetical protein
VTSVTPVTSVETIEVRKMKEEQTALRLLQEIYRDAMVPLPTRMRAAIESLPYENPRMSAVAVGYLNSEDFYSRLDRAIERNERARRSDRAKLIEGQAVEVEDR